MLETSYLRRESLYNKGGVITINYLEKAFEIQSTENKTKILNENKILPNGFRKWTNKQLQQMSSMALKLYMQPENQRKISNKYQKLNEEGISLLTNKNTEDIKDMIHQKDFSSLMLFLHSDNKEENNFVKKYLESFKDNEPEMEIPSKTEQNEIDDIDKLRKIIINLEKKINESTKSNEDLHKKINEKDQNIVNLNRELSLKEKQLKNKNIYILEVEKALDDKIEEVNALEQDYKKLNENKKIIENELQIFENQRKIEMSKIYLLIGSPLNLNIEDKLSIEVWEKDKIEETDVEKFRVSDLIKIAYVPRLTMRERSLLNKIQGIRYLYSYTELKEFMTGVE